jgi:hypothetical protein
MVKLSDLFKKVLKIEIDRDSYTSEDNCWWLLNEQTISELLAELNIPIEKDIYDYRESLFDSDILGEKIGIPEKEIPIDEIERVKINDYYIIYLDNPPKLI